MCGEKSQEFQKGGRKIKVRKKRKKKKKRGKRLKEGKRRKKEVKRGEKEGKRGEKRKKGGKGGGGMVKGENINKYQDGNRVEKEGNGGENIYSIKSEKRL